MAQIGTHNDGTHERQAIQLTQDNGESLMILDGDGKPFALLNTVHCSNMTSIDIVPIAGGTIRAWKLGEEVLDIEGTTSLVCVFKFRDE
jgi:hypothetical protein